MRVCVCVCMGVVSQFHSCDKLEDVTKCFRQTAWSLDLILLKVRAPLLYIEPRIEPFRARLNQSRLISLDEN